MNRRQLLKKLALSGTALATVPSFYLYQSNEKYMPEIKSFISNPDLESVVSMDKWPGTPLDQNGLFINEKDVFWPMFKDLLKWQTSTNPYKDIKKNDKTSLEVITHNSPDLVPDNSIVWLGHASFLIHVNGLRLLIDPVLGSPSFLKRFSKEPFEENTLANNDFILISHNHRDHCDKRSIQLLAALNPSATWLCGLKLDSVLRKWAKIEKIQAAGWYQQYNIPQSVKISYLPTRHWSRRGLTDTNETLWGAFLIEGNGKKIYFGGDSGYGSHVGNVREIFGQVDYYLAGIGAFAPRWFMGPSHMHPEEAAQAANDLQPKNLIPMHYGTFDLSDEPLLEPARLIKELYENKAFSCNLVMPRIGEAISI